MRVVKHSYTVLVKKPDVKRPLGILKRRWKDNIKIVIRRIGREVWTELVWLRVGTGGGLL
jgi:hypothetical protein